MASIEAPIGTVGIVAGPDGVRRVLLPGSRAAEPAASGPVADEAASQLEEYFAGGRREFELPLDWSGVDARLCEILEELVAAAPYGRTLTYGELGRLVGEEDARAIGVAMARNPLPLVVPCHRVVAADGIGGYGGGVELKRQLLELEHVLPPRLPLVG
jgi:methylated-DNA-[protein]-cysteine S-methyltransferase